MGLFDDLNIDLGGIDLSAFDLADFKGEPEEDDPMEDAIWTRPVVRRPKVVCYEHAQDFARALAIDPEHETFAFVSGNFVFGDLIEALVDARKLTIRTLGIQTLSMSDENIDSLRNVLEMQPVERLDLVLSDYWYAHESHKAGLVPYLFEELDLDGLELRVAFAGVHCKVVTIETLRGNHLTMHGSANLRSSGNVEQLHISPDDGLYEFCDGMTQRILDAYDVVNQGDRKRKKSVRRARLWQAMTTPEEYAEAEASAAKAAAAAEAPAADGTSAGRRSPRTPETGAGARQPTHPRASTTTSPSRDMTAGGRDG